MISITNRRRSIGLPALSVMSLAMLPVAGAAATDADRAAERAAMTAEVAAMARDVSETGRAHFDPRVLDAMRRVPRHRFVPASQAAHAYDNRPLPIGHGQTISQPYIVALMTDLMRAKPGDKVLEIGTGSGYQAAVLAELGAKVFTIEIVEPLGKDAARRLQDAGYTTVATRIGDGYIGWAEAAPFDSIIVTAAPSHVPPALVEQLKPGGRMVIPVGSTPFTQHLMVLEKGTDGHISRRQILPVRFVPLTGKR